MELRRVCHRQGWMLTVYFGIITLSVSLLSEIGYLVAVVIGLAGLPLWQKGKLPFREIFRKGKPMKAGSLFRIGSLFISLQLVYYVLSALWAGLWKGLGMEYVPVTSVNLDSWPVLLYVALAAPLSEELLFRGVILQSLRPYGRQFAIVASSLLFAFFHGDLIQGIFAFGMGVVLGYVTAEYHILWAALLHFFNNFVLAYLLPRIGRWLGVGELLVWALVLCAGAVAVFVLIRRGEGIVRYLWKGIRAPLCWRGFFTATGTAVFLVLMAFFATLNQWLALYS